MTPQRLLKELQRWGFEPSSDVLAGTSTSTLDPSLLDDLTRALEGTVGGDFASTEEQGARISLALDAVHNATDLKRTAPEWVQRLPAFDGEVILDGEPIERAAWDYGKVRHRTPAAVLRPAHADDVARAVRFCRREGIGLSPRGFAHSAGGQMQVHGGLVLDMKSMQRVLAMEDNWVEVEAGAGWDVVLSAAMDKGRTPPIVTDWLKVSVGGTISMGGFGFMSFWRGTQMDHLLELEVVTGTGETVRCSAGRNPDLFGAVKGTHGKFGIITKARIPLEQAPESVRLVQACYAGLGDMYRDFERHALGRSTDLIHAFAAERTRGSIVTRMNSTEALDVEPAAVDRLLEDGSSRWVYNLELVDFIGGPHGDRHPPVSTAELHCAEGLVDAWEMDWKSFCFRVPPLVLEEQFRGAAPHPELCAWVPMTTEGLALLEAEFKRMDPARDVGNGPVLFFPLRTDKVNAPFFRLPASEHCLFWGLLRRAEPASHDRIAQLMGDNETLFSRIRDIGGARYLPDTPPDTRAFWTAHFGERWGEIQAARERWDPDRVFASSFGNFS